MTAKRWPGLGAIAVGAGIAVVAILVGYPYFVVLPLVGVAVLAAPSVNHAWPRAMDVRRVTEEPFAGHTLVTDHAGSAYSTRIAEPSSAAKERTGWWNAINNVMCSFSGMATASPDPGPRASQPKTDVEITYIPSGAVVARLRAPVDTAHRLAELMTRDLQALSVSDFEHEWNVTPTAVPQQPR